MKVNDIEEVLLQSLTFRQSLIILQLSAEVLCVWSMCTVRVVHVYCQMILIINWIWIILQKSAVCEVLCLCVWYMCTVKCVLHWQGQEDKLSLPHWTNSALNSNFFKLILLWQFTPRNLRYGRGLKNLPLLLAKSPNPPKN